MTVITRTTIANEIKNHRQDIRDYPYYTTIQPRDRAGIVAKAYDLALPAYAWPGGYDMIYYPEDERGNLTGDVLCYGCARTDLQTKNSAGMHCETGDGCEEEVTCDQCGGTIIAAPEEEIVSDEQAEYDDYHCIDWDDFRKTV